MKISFNWLKDYLKVDLSPEAVGQILTDTGLEVEGIEKKQSIEGGLEGLVVGEVLTAEQHPNADRLKITKVNVGLEEPLQIVCGAPNVVAGQKVVVATVGTKLFPTKGDPFGIKKGKIRGEVSMGMICAEDEIGLGEEHDGIIVLPESTAVGTAIAEVYDLEDDFVFEVGLTPNRSDGTNHVGVAKDLAAALQINHSSAEQVQMPIVSDFKVDNTSLPFEVEVRDTEACPRYAGLTISGVEVKASPDWLKLRLEAIGVRPINNIVDITNFILHELGQPLHAFDADKVIGNKVIVQKLPEDTPFLALDETERKLLADDLMICDGDGNGMCIAGVFGGLNSGVTDGTTKIFLESACFHPIQTRKTSGKHNLRTDAAIRFEKGVDPNSTVYALKRAALLIRDLAGGAISSEIIDVYPTKIERTEIDVRFARVNSVIGTKISAAEVKAILLALEFEILEETEDALKVSVGTNRSDVLREIDVIEEILRIYGFNKVPLPAGLKTSIAFRPKPDNTAIKNTVADRLAAQGFNEMMGTSITNSSYYEEADSVVPLLNSLNANLDVLRKQMLFSGLEAISHNQNHKNTDLSLFEFGKTYTWYSKEEVKKYEESEHLSLFLTGKKSSESWRGEQIEVSFFDLKSAVKSVLDRLGIFNYQTKDSTNSVFQYGLDFTQGKVSLVQFGLVSGKVKKAFGIKQAVYYADFNWGALIKNLKKSKLNYKAISRFPKMRRDLALIIDKTVAFNEISQIATKTGKQILESVNLFDIFESEEKIGKGKKSYAISLVFQDPRKTLTDKEVDKVMSKLIQLLEDNLGAKLRD